MIVTIDDQNMNNDGSLSKIKKKQPGRISKCSADILLLKGDLVVC